MGTEASPQAPQYIPGPKPKSAGDNLVSSVQGLKAVSPDIYNLNELFGPKYAELGYDIQADIGPKQAQLDFDISSKMAPQWLDLVLGSVKTADPTGFELSEEVKRTALDDLRRGGALDPAEEDAARRRVSGGLKRIGRGEGIADQFTSSQYLTDQEYGRKVDRMMRALGISQGLPGLSNLGVSSVRSGNLPNVENRLFETPSTSTIMSDARVGEAGRRHWQDAWNTSRMNTGGEVPNKWQKLFTNLNSMAGGAVGGYFGGPIGAQMGMAAGRDQANAIGSFF